MNGAALLKGPHHTWDFVPRGFSLVDSSYLCPGRPLALG